MSNKFLCCELDNNYIQNKNDVYNHFIKFHYHDIFPIYFSICSICFLNNNIKYYSTNKYSIEEYLYKHIEYNHKEFINNKYGFKNIFWNKKKSDTRYDWDLKNHIINLSWDIYPNVKQYITSDIKISSLYEDDFSFPQK